MAAAAATMTMTGDGSMHNTHTYKHVYVGSKGKCKGYAAPSRASASTGVGVIRSSWWLRWMCLGLPTYSTWLILPMRPGREETKRRRGWYVWRVECETRGCC